MLPDRSEPPIVGVIEPAYPDYAIERGILEPAGVRFVLVEWGGDRARLLAAVAGLDVVLLREGTFDAGVIACMKPGSGLVRYGVGVDSVDLAAATARGVRVANVPDYGADIEVSDHAAALTLALVRRVVSRHADVLRGRWNVGQAEPIYRVADCTLGLVGFGKIARAYLQRMRAFGISRLLVHDPFVSAATLAAHGAQPTGLDELFATAQIVSLHAPATAQTRHLIDAGSLALMGPRTCLINTSRGALVDEVALAAALKAGRLFGAALDVQEVEPMPADSPLRDAPNLILTDHTGWYSEATVAALHEGAARAALEILRDGRPTHWVNRPV